MAKRQRGTAQSSFFLFLVLFSVFQSLCWSAAVAQTLPAETEAKIRAVLASPKLAEAHVGLSILDLGEVKDAVSFPANRDYVPRVLLEVDAQKKFMPASNMKLYTAAIALARIGKANSFATTVFVDEKPDSNWRSNGGVLRGDIYLVGGGDPSLSLENVKNLALKVQKLGIKRIEGDVIADGQAFSAESFGGRYPDGWTLDDTIWYYGAPVSALALNRNQVDVTFTGSTKPGEPAQILIEPACEQLIIENRVSTVAASSAVQSSLNWDRSERDGKVVYTVSGKIAPKQKVNEGLAVPESDLWAAQYFRTSLEGNGIAVVGQAHAGIWKDSSPRRSEIAPLTQHVSPDLQTLLKRLLKNSDNLYAEMLLRDAAYYDGGTGGSSAAPHAHELLKNWLAVQNIDTSTLLFRDGSGLSRYNLLTPHATAELLAAINRMPEGEAIWNALPIAGVDGTLRTRLRNTPAGGNARAKTGSFSIASSLSGYVTTQGKRRLAVSMFVNFARDTDTARWAQDEIFAALAG